jgi:hypothetical protein
MKNVGYGNKKSISKNGVVVRSFRGGRKNTWVVNKDGVKEIWKVGKLSKSERVKIRGLWKFGGYKLVK